MPLFDEVFNGEITTFKMIPFKLFGCKRKLDVFSFVEGFFLSFIAELRKEKKTKSGLKTTIF